MNQTPTCIRCKSPMETGFVVDRGDYSLPDYQRWVEGVAERSHWTGLKTAGREIFAVTTYRCQQCGYLESYAKEPTKL